MIRLKLEEIIKAVDGKILNQNFQNDLSTEYIVDVSTDTRKLNRDCLFIPIIGENFDGHEFIEKAFENGAKLAFTQKQIETDRGILVYVKDTKEALGKLAKYYLKIMNIPVIAITGSVGKTSCKDMVASVLDEKYNVLKTQGNFNNDIGLPLTILRLTNEHEIIVLEMGMNHFGEIEKLVNISNPNVAIITNIGVSHIENLGSREGILKAKLEIVSRMKKDDVVIINGDDNLLRKNKEKLPCIVKSFGIEEENMFNGTITDLNGWEGTKGIIKTPEEQFTIHIPTIGSHMMYHALAAVAVGKIFGLNIEQMQEGIKNFAPSAMRLNIHSLKGGIRIIDDAYNASTDSMKAALKTLQSLPTDGRRIAILGDMFEMGQFAKEGHEEVGQFAKNQKVDLLICVGEDAKYIYSAKSENCFCKTYYFESVEKLNENITKLIKEKDLILVKASRGMHLEKTIDYIKEVNC